MNRLTNKKIANIEKDYFITMKKEEYLEQVKNAPKYEEIYKHLSIYEDLLEKYNIDMEKLDEILKIYFNERWEKMNRLTELIDIDGMEIKVSKERPLSNQNLGEILHKLYALEDIEEEIGIDLITLFKALKYGIYKKGKNNFKGLILYSKMPMLLFYHKTIDVELIEDYGKTWALTREELEE